MTEVKAVRAALEQIRNQHKFDIHTEIEEAIVSEGLAACDEYEDAKGADDGEEPGYHEYVRMVGVRVHVFASILKKVGLL